MTPPPVPHAPPDARIAPAVRSQRELVIASLIRRPDQPARPGAA
jgi:hypothetical protein